MIKQTQLLEAIGHIDEKTLQEAEPRAATTVRRRFCAAVAAALIAVLSVTAAAAGILLFGSGNTMPNISTGSGRFAYDAGYIYYGGPGYICQVDPDSGKLEKIDLGDAHKTPTSLFVTEAGIAYISDYDTLELVTPEGNVRQLLQNTGARFFADGTTAYTHNGAQLRKIDLQTGESTVLADNSHGYYVDGEYIYALTEGNRFLRSSKDTIAFEEVPLSFHPAGILADGEDLYFSKYLKSGGYQLIHYRDGVENRLPVYGYFAQKLENRLYYLDSIEKDVLKTYDLTTGQTAVLAEHVYEFSLLEGRYLCVDFYDAIIVDPASGGEINFHDFSGLKDHLLEMEPNDASIAIIDLQTDQMKKLNP